MKLSRAVMARTRWRFAVAIATFAAVSLPVLAGDGGHGNVLRVCQDPNNLPFSNSRLEGFENKIAALFARELGWGIEYTWYPQRMGFIRNTLRAKEENSDTYKCDLVTGVQENFELGMATRPYYHSSYAMAYVKGKGLDGVRALEDLLKIDPEKRKSLRLGVFVRSPVLDWLLENGMIEQVVSYQHQTGDPDQYPGQIVEKDLANGKIDIAFVWGPIAGYFANKARTAPIAMVPLKPRPNAHFDFRIAMGVRYGDKALKERIDRLIEKNTEEIKAILSEYSVPQLDEQGNFIGTPLN